VIEGARVTRLRLLPLAVLALAAPSASWAGGLARPSAVGARAIGLGGAFTAVADDPTAIYHNPSGLAFPEESQVYLGAEGVWLDRTWVRPDGVAIPETTSIQLIPTVGGSTRFALPGEKPSRFAVGVAAYLSYGGALDLTATDKSGNLLLKNSLCPRDAQSLLTNCGADGITQSTLILYEVAPAVAYQVSDVLALGASLRVGIGYFSASDKEAIPAPYATQLSAIGTGVGGSFSATLRPHPRVQLGAIYRTGIDTNLSGGGPVSISGGAPVHYDLNVVLHWPQSAALGVQVRATPWLRVVAQADWEGWSSWESLPLDFHDPTFNAAALRQFRYKDTYTFHLGGEANVGRRLQLRLGANVDTGAVPNEYLRRESRDGTKYDFAAGASVFVGRFRIDAVVDFLYAPDLTFTSDPPPKGTGTVPPGGEPGTYGAKVVTFGLAGLVRF
jgi:long-chain fatty acid transport protein